MEMNSIEGESKQNKLNIIAFYSYRFLVVIFMLTVQLLRNITPKKWCNSKIDYNIFNEMLNSACTAEL